MAIILQIFTIELIFTVALTFLCFYAWFRYKFTYWRKKSVSGPNPTFPFGNIRDVILRKKQFFQPYIDSYNEYKHLPYVGMYSFQDPVLCVNDPEVAKCIFIKDFDNFQAHGIFSGGQGDVLAGHLFNRHGEPWRTLRAKISPTFTAGKVKGMYPLVDHIANDALNYVDLLNSNGETVNFSKLYSNYSMEIIGSVGFGVECNGFKNPNSEFYLRGHEYFEPQSLYWTFVRALAFFLPNFFKALKIKRISPKITNFFYRLVKESVEYRQKHSYRRNDFLQTIVDLKNEEKTGKPNGYSFSMDDVVANTMLYMFAGYETSATVGQFAAYELACNPAAQAKAREEILRVLKKHNGQYTYEAQNEMVYLNMVIDETMRMHPPMRALFRRCTKTFKVPNSDLVIEKGTLVFVPIEAIQMDPDIFPEPNKFDPERFSPKKKAKMHPCHWMPFGEGPRKCLGIRQGYIQSKMALAKILQNYELLLSEKTSVPFKMKASSMAYAAEGDIWLKLRQIRHD